MSANNNECIGMCIVSACVSASLGLKMSEDVDLVGEALEGVGSEGLDERRDF
jgi:hypothetical protein